MKTAQQTILLVLMLLLASNCQEKKEATPSQQEEAQGFTIITINYPLDYFVRSLTSDDVDINLISSNAQDPAHWIPQREEIMKMQEADLIVLNGSSYEPWLEDISLPSSKILRTADIYPEKLITETSVTSHSHGPEGEHEHENTSTTTWLDFELAGLQLKAIYRRLSEMGLMEESLLDKNYTDLNNQLEELDTQLRAVDFTDKHLIFSHPIYQYMTARYNIHSSCVTWEPDVMPDTEDWKQLEHLIHHQSNTLFVWEKEPLVEIKNKMYDLNIPYIVFDPMYKASPNSDYIETMRSQISNLTRAIDNN